MRFRKGTTLLQKLSPTWASPKSWRPNGSSSSIDESDRYYRERISVAAAESERVDFLYKRAQLAEGELGDRAEAQRIYNEISMEAWKMWIEHSKMVVNEYRLDLTSAEAHKTLKDQCEAFLFGEGAALPPDFVAPAQK